MDEAIVQKMAEYSSEEIKKIYDLFNRYRDLLGIFKDKFTSEEINELQKINTYYEESQSQQKGIKATKAFETFTPKFFSICSHIQNEAEKYYKLAYRYKYVEKNNVKAIEFYKKAASFKHAEAQNQLGQCFRDGDGTEKDYDIAENYFKLAVSQGHRGAEYNLKNLRGLLGINLYKNLSSLKIRSGHEVDSGREVEWDKYIKIDYKFNEEKSLKKIQELIEQGEKISINFILSHDASSQQKLFESLKKSPCLEEFLNEKIDPQGVGCSWLHLVSYQPYSHSLEQMLELPVNVSVKDNIGETAAHYAARAGNTQSLALLFEKEKKLLTVENFFQNSPLSIAILSGHSHVIDYLLDEGAEISLNDLYIADSNIIKILMNRLKNSARLSSVIQRELSIYQGCLYPFIFKRDKDLLKYLIELGADINAKDSFYGTVAHCVVHTEDVETLKFLIERNKSLLLNAKDQNGTTPLILAIVFGCFDMVNYLLSHREIDLEAEITLPWDELHSEHGKTALKYALERAEEQKDEEKRDHYIEVIKKLMLLGAKISIGRILRTKEPIKTILLEALKDSPRLKEFFEEKISEDQESWLHIAGLKNDTKLVARLLELGANINATDKNGNTVAHAIAAKAKKGVDALKIFLEKNKELLNAKNNMGDTPLRTAIINKRWTIAAFLLGQEGIDIQAAIRDLINEAGKRIGEVQRNACLEMIKKLISSGAKVSIEDILNAKGPIKMALLEALKNSPRQKEFLEEKVGEHQENWLLVAARRDDITTVNYLWTLGADIKFKNTLGSTIIHVAACSGSLEVLETLYAKQPDLWNVVNNYGNTPLMSAILINTEKAKQAVKYILNKQNTNIKHVASVLHDEKHQNNGKRALNYAVENGNREAIEQMISRGEVIEVGDIISVNPSLRKELLDIIENYPKFKKNIQNEVEKANNTWLHAASWSGDLALVEYFVALNANLNARSEKGETALQVAATKGRVEILQFLLNKDKRLLNAKDKAGDTALIYAIMNQQWAAAEFILTQEGVDIEVATNTSYPNHRKRGFECGIEHYKKLKDKKEKQACLKVLQKFVALGVSATSDNFSDCPEAFQSTVSFSGPNVTIKNKETEKAKSGSSLMDFFASFFSKKEKPIDEKNKKEDSNDPTTKSTSFNSNNSTTS